MSILNKLKEIWKDMTYTHTFDDTDIDAIFAEREKLTPEECQARFIKFNREYIEDLFSDK